MLPKRYRLKKEFGKTLSRGKRIRSKSFILLYSVKDTEKLSIGFLITKKVGGAVLRNKIRRRLSNILHSNLDTIRKDINMVIIPSKFTNWKALSYNEIEQELLLAIKQL